MLIAVSICFEIYTRFLGSFFAEADTPCTSIMSLTAGNVNSRRANLVTLLQSDERKNLVRYIHVDAKPRALANWASIWFDQPT